ncbi:RpiB/LacA/LacB family sugar-phosphate isomerase [Burkholderia ubonensis]|uniref:RpiB/LacA/LacB family sugar-phosphate isomerase n=1 Tax=Burkholderia ubonensis TaxID=101571 RepID=UPI0009B42AF5|nr:RpiB/LacA/LacB family sugar-phosphate isomerase [Burkholderia ubonensis]
MRIAISSDTGNGIASVISQIVTGMGHHVIEHGAIRDGQAADWVCVSAEAARDVAEGRADQAIVCCFTGTGATITANKIPGIRAALCVDSFTAAGARRWNDANVLGISLRLTTEQVLKEILAAWFSTEDDGSQRETLRILNKL